MEFLSFATFMGGVFWGAAAALGLILKYCDIQKKHPYVWTCPEENCDFRVSSNVAPEVLLSVADNHSLAHKEI